MSKSSCVAIFPGTNNPPKKNIISNSLINYIPKSNRKEYFPNIINFSKCSTCLGSGRSFIGVCLECKGTGKMDNKIIL